MVGLASPQRSARQQDGEAREAARLAEEFLALHAEQSASDARPIDEMRALSAGLWTESWKAYLLS